jgi:hypothetical protein
MGDAAVREQLAHRIVPMRDSGRFPDALIERFAAWVANAPEEELFRVNPLQFAERESLDARDAVDLFVHAARAGIFDFSWGVLCRDCGAFITTKGGLRSLGRKRFCKL